MQELISEASYLDVTCDKTTAIDNSLWLCLYVYVMENWDQKPFLLTLQKLEFGWVYIRFSPSSCYWKDRGKLDCSKTNLFWGRWCELFSRL